MTEGTKRTVCQCRKTAGSDTQDKIPLTSTSPLLSSHVHSFVSASPVVSLDTSPWLCHSVCLSLSLPHCQATKRDLEKRHRTREVGDTQHEKSFCPRDTKQVDQRRQSFWSFGSTLEEKGRSMSLHTKLRAPKNVQPNMGMCAVCVSCHSLRVFASFQDSLATVG